MCNTFESREALARAKRNVEERYAVVGVTEDFHKSLRVLEAYVPRYFAGAGAMYEEQMSSYRVNKNTVKPRTSEAVREELRRNFTVEYEFYHFCRQRLDKQYSLIVD